MKGGAMKLGEIIKWQTVSGEAVTVGDVTIVPQSRALTLRWGRYGGLVWNRPAAILVERGDQTKRIPVVDYTRVVQLGLLGFCLIVCMVALVVSARQRRVS
jgi:hypothetical protein